MLIGDAKTSCGNIAAHICVEELLLRQALISQRAAQLLLLLLLLVLRFRLLIDLAEVVAAGCREQAFRCVIEHPRVGWEAR